MSVSASLRAPGADGVLACGINVTPLPELQDGGDDACSRRARKVLSRLVAVSQEQST